MLHWTASPEGKKLRLEIIQSSVLDSSKNYLMLKLCALKVNRDTPSNPCFLVWSGTKRHKSGCWPKMVWHLLLLQTLPTQARIIPLIISATGRPSIKTGLACVKPSKLLLLHQNKGECFRPRLKSGRHEKLGQICEGCRCCLGFAGDFCSNHSDFARSSRTLGGRAVSPFYIFMRASLSWCVMRAAWQCM